MTGRLVRAVLAALLIAFLPSATWAEERITLFSSDIIVRPDASLLVSETIDVVAEGDRIRRGIYRDFPTRYRGRSGGRHRVGFELLGVTRNGDPEPAKVEAIPGGVRIRIGDPDRLIGNAEHRYVIRYRTDRQIGFFDDFDELYWNVTGNGWGFPIEVAEARIALPSPVRFGQRAVYTGPAGATGRAAEVAGERPGEISFRTTAPLAPYEGLTVAAAWPKGVVAAPSEEDRARWWLGDYGPLVVGVLALGGLLLFYWIAWKRAGDDPEPGTIVPLFSPPDDLSPAAMRYVWKMGADNRAFAAALVDLGVKGHVRMVEEDGGWLSGNKVRLERLASSQPVPDTEQAMLTQLAMTGESILMEQKNHEKFSAAKKMLDQGFKRRFEGKLFHRNWGWAFAGLALFAAAVWLTGAAVASATGVSGLTEILVSAGATVAAGLFLLLLNDASKVGKCLIAAAAMVFGGIAMVAGVPVLVDALATGWWWPFLPVAFAFPLVLSAFWWISAPTKEGRAVLDRIAGFRQYLSIAEGERLDRMTPHERTPELFERYLPYAIALGVENRWADRFRGVLAAASAQQGAQGFHWYSGSSTPWSDADGFVDSVGSSLASSVGSASTAPGSGGGGASGGGGGGGGGGGW